MSLVYVFEATVVKAGAKYLIYPPKDYQEKLARYHKRKVKVIVVVEEP